MRTSRKVKRSKRRSTRYSLHAARPALEPRGHAGAPPRIARDGFFDAAAIHPDAAADQRQVGLLHLAAGKLRGQGAMRGIVLGHQQHAAGIAVEAVDDAGPQLAAQRGERLEAIKQRVDQRAGVHSRARVNHHAGGLVDGYEIVVFIEDAQRNRFGHGAQRGQFGRLDLDAVALPQQARRPLGRSVHAHAAILDPGAVYSEQPFALGTGFTRTLDWAGFQCALVAGAAYALWKEKQWQMGAWILLSLVAVAAGWRFFPRYYFQLLPVMTLAAARGYVLMGRWRAVMWILLLVPLARFGPRYAMLANDLVHDRQIAWSDIALNQDSHAAADRIAREGTLLVWGYRPDIFAYTRMQAGSRFLDSQPLTGVLADRHLTSTKAMAPEWAEQNRRELIQTKPTWIVDGLGPLNPALAIGRYPDLAGWLRAYREVRRTRYTVIYKLW
jgi:hypothetical protein